MSPCRASVAIVSALAALALCQGARALAQQSPVASERPSGPTVDFVTIDADGTPIADLRSSEVEIRIADRVRVVRSLRRVTTAPPNAATVRARIPPPYGTN